MQLEKDAKYGLLSGQCPLDASRSGISAQEPKGAHRNHGVNQYLRHHAMHLYVSLYPRSLQLQGVVPRLR